MFITPSPVPDFAFPHPVSTLHETLAAASQSSTSRALVERVNAHRHVYHTLFEGPGYTSLWSDIDQVRQGRGGFGLG